MIVGNYKSLKGRGVGGFVIRRSRFGARCPYTKNAGHCTDHMHSSRVDGAGMEASKAEIRSFEIGDLRCHPNAIYTV